MPAICRSSSHHDELMMRSLTALTLPGLSPAAGAEWHLLWFECVHSWEVAPAWQHVLDSCQHHAFRLLRQGISDAFMPKETAFLSCPSVAISEQDHPQCLDWLAFSVLGPNHHHWHCPHEAAESPPEQVATPLQIQ